MEELESGGDEGKQVSVFHCYVVEPSVINTGTKAVFLADEEEAGPCQGGERSDEARSKRLGHVLVHGEVFWAGEGVQLASEWSSAR